MFVSVVLVHCCLLFVVFFVWCFGVCCSLFVVCCLFAVVAGLLCVVFLLVH